MRRRDIHFANLKHDQKVVVCQEIARRPIQSCVVFSNKQTIPGSLCEGTFKKPGYLYNYLTRQLLERVVLYCAADAQAQGKRGAIKVVFSRRGNTNYQKMKDYIDTKVRNGSGRPLFDPPPDWDILDSKNIIVQDHKNWAGLQLADSVTSAYFKAVESDPYGNYETRYADLLKSNAIAGPLGCAMAGCVLAGCVLGFGVAPVPNLRGRGSNEAQKKFFNSFALVA